MNTQFRKALPGTGLDYFDTRAAVEAIDAGGTEVEVGRLLAGLVEGGRQTSGAYKKTWR